MKTKKKHVKCIYGFISYVFIFQDFLLVENLF